MNKSLIGEFIKIAEEMPDKVALINECSEQLTYGELFKKAVCITEELQSNGMKVGDTVAISLPRGFDMVCAVVATLIGGGVYVPVSLNQPIGRRNEIYNQADINYCITYQERTIKTIRQVKEIFLDKELEKTNYNNLYEVDPMSTAYIIFTSGSTGLPKGVEISHDAAMNTIEDINKRFNINSDDCFIALSALDFDLSVYDLFGALSVGARIVIVPDELQKEPSEWLKLAKKNGVTVWNSVPAIAEMAILSVTEEGMLDAVKVFLVSGDWIMPSLVEMINKYCPSTRFIALGGATECSIWSNFYEVIEIEPEWAAVPYGKPLTNQKFRIINESGKDANKLEIGELWIGGRGLAKGYIGNTELTSKAFVIDGGERWYKTGDIGYYQEDHNIIFMGRKDTQVKINGYRIEISEIEKQLKQLEGISRSVVVVKKDENTNRLGTVIAFDNIHKRNTKNVVTKCIQTDINNDHEVALEAIVHEFIEQILLDKSKKEIFDEAQFGEELKRVVKIWREFLGERSIDRNIQMLPEKLRCFRNQLLNKTELYQEILSNQTSKLALLNDEVVAPDKLNINLGNIYQMVNRIGDRLMGQMEKRFLESDEKFKIALVLGRRGEVYRPLLERLSRYTGKIEILYIESSHALLKDARQNYEHFNLDISYIKAVYPTMDAHLAASVDAVVIANGLHMFKDIDKGLAWSSMLLKEKGMIYASEPTQLSALGIITAAVIEDGFINYDTKRRTSCNPMLTAKEWLLGIENAGYENIQVDEYVAEKTVVFAATIGMGNVVPNYNTMVNRASQKLLQYMMPKEIIYTVEWLLTDNGKVDRKEILKWFDSDIKQNKGKQPSTDVQRKIATIWKELLQIENVYLDQNFFDLGGDSLLVTRMISNLRQSFGVNITMREIFNQASLENISKIIEDRLIDSDFEEGEL